ncbi:MAG TPA: rhodanese-like domain-containing protein [Bacteroidota bacterium]|nr:rhodanese-like domain-containing protein [Bacteroidota bacterium]
MNRRLWRECGITLLLAAVLGFGYSYFTKQGYFARTSAAADQPKLIVVSLPEAKAAFDSHAATFIDARHEFEFSEGHIQGAMNIPFAHLDQHAYLLDSLSNEKRLIVYCDGVACNSSIELAAKLKEHGFSRVEVFYGGWQDWTNAGYPIERAGNHARSGMTK